MVKKYYDGKESYSHIFAKETLRSWLTRNWKGVDYPLLHNINFFDKETKEDLSFGSCPDFVYLEYPITNYFPCLIDEGNSACNSTFENPYEFCTYRSMQIYCPCLKCPKFDLKQVKYVCDIAIEHKGTISAIIEVKHKHATPQKKSNVIAEGTSVFEIDAKHILGQIGVPSRLFVTRLYPELKIFSKEIVENSREKLRC